MSARRVGLLVDLGIPTGWPHTADQATDQAKRQWLEGPGTRLWGLDWQKLLGPSRRWWHDVCKQQVHVVFNRGFIHLCLLLVLPCGIGNNLFLVIFSVVLSYVVYFFFLFLLFLFFRLCLGSWLWSGAASNAWIRIIGPSVSPLNSQTTGDSVGEWVHLWILKLLVTR